MANRVDLMGKTFYFNRNEAQNGKKYMTIVGKMKGEQVDKVTLFPGQLPSFIHQLLVEYGEYLSEEDLNFLEMMPSPEAQASSSSSDDSDVERNPEDGFPMDCPYCDEPYEKGSISPTGNTCWVMCVECGKSVKGSRAEGRDLAERLHEAGAH